jgi:hypothetical protein
LVKKAAGVTTNKRLEELSALLQSNSGSVDMLLLKRNSLNNLNKTTNKDYVGLLSSETKSRKTSYADKLISKKKYSDAIKKL